MFFLILLSFNCIHKKIQKYKLVLSIYCSINHLENISFNASRILLSYQIVYVKIISF